ncbi:HIT domain-containing protein [Streptomyces huasconensis]|uniref:HIT domain-containing protein n=1 Tax=Streptomyces huasconensis TaxID=1854574 RepID=A0ABV3M1N7_9ACTN
MACVFCEIVAGRAPASVVRKWDDALAFVPLNPVTEGHVLVVPKVHVADVGANPAVASLVEARVSELVAELPAANALTSKGGLATQTVFHYHAHVLPRRPGDGLALPWDVPASLPSTAVFAPQGLHTGRGSQTVIRSSN